MKSKMHHNLKRPWLLAGIFAGFVTGPASAVDWNHHEWDTEFGPKNWANLDPTWGTCSSGQTQSPIDITTAVSKSGSAPLEFHYTPNTLQVVNTGHVIEVPYANGSELRVGTESYFLQSLQFHVNSEHKLLGAQFDMEVHLVHANALEQTAIVSVFLKAGTAQNNLVSAVFDPAAAGSTVDVMDLLVHAKQPGTSSSEPEPSEPVATAADVFEAEKQAWKDKKAAWKDEWKAKKVEWDAKWDVRRNDVQQTVADLFGNGRFGRFAMRMVKRAYSWARKDARKDFNEARKASREEFKKARKEAMKEARAARKAAKKNGGSAPAGDSGDSDNTEPSVPYADEYYSYMGSLTMPPCTEGVKWFVLPHVVDISGASLTSMQELVSGFPMYWEVPFNNRPVVDWGTHEVFQHTP